MPLLRPNTSVRSAVQGAILFAVVSAAVVCIDVSTAMARRQGDRIGLRLGVWPQPDARETLSSIQFDRNGDTIYDAVVDEAGIVGPFAEFFALFHLGGIWWAEAAIGWSRRSDIEVAGIRQNAPPKDTTRRILLATGRIDFIPLFLGARVAREFGEGPRPHNVYGRGGLSLVFAGESPAAVFDRVSGLYHEGTEGAIGFALGAGGVYYVVDKLGIGADLHYRYAKFKYGPRAEFDQSAVWAAVSVVINTR